MAVGFKPEPCRHSRRKHKNKPCTRVFKKAVEVAKRRPLSSSPHEDATPLSLSLPRMGINIRTNPTRNHRITNKLQSLPNSHNPNHSLLAKMLSQALLLSLLAASVFLATAGIIETDPIVRTNSGMLVGQKVKLETGNSIYRFLGVPYAQAPIGQNRFERPKWIINQTERIVLAQQPKPTCIQMRHISKTISPLLEVDQIHNVSFPL